MKDVHIPLKWLGCFPRSIFKVALLVLQSGHVPRFLWTLHFWQVKEIVLAGRPPFAGKVVLQHRFTAHFSFFLPR
ncbi:MAG: hypothetical protein NZ804_06375, partial [Roseibacillus sp.]|nr:hypothetical protein [Roseibacillus sp.]